MNLDFVICSNRKEIMVFSFVESTRIKIELNEGDKKQISSYDKINKAIENKNVIVYDIYLIHELIGFAMFRGFDKGFFLWNNAIDSHDQGQDYGSKVLKELLLFIKDNFGINFFTTTYLWGNEHAKHVYEKVGFIETDIVKKMVYMM